MVRDVRLSPVVQREIGRGKIPAHVATKLLAWVESVKSEGLEEVRKVPGFHDEPLKGSRAGQRSLRLSKQWRAIYEVHSQAVKFVMVEEVTPHKY